MGNIYEASDDSGTTGKVAEDGGSRGIGADFDFTVALADAFLHSREADADAGAIFLEALEDFGGHTRAIIPDLKSGGLTIRGDVDVGLGAARMSLNVGEGFLKHVEQGEFQVASWLSGRPKCTAAGVISIPRPGAWRLRP